MPNEKDIYEEKTNRVTSVEEAGFDVSRELIEIMHGQIWVLGELTPAVSAYDFISKFHQIKKYRETSEIQSKKISVNVNSVGGSLEELFAILDFIDRRRKEGWTFVITNIAQAMSASAFLVFYGDESYASPRSIFMIHESFGASDNNYSSARSDMNGRWNAYHNEMIKILTDKSNKESSYWEDKLRIDYYFSATDAKKYSLITDII